MGTIAWLTIWIGGILYGAGRPAEPRPEPVPPATASAPETAAEPTWDIPITLNDAVDRWLIYFQTRGRERFQVYLTRSGRYEPMLRAILRDEGLPEDLVYLSLIESGFNPNAYSPAHAVGLWQFIASTGRLNGLRIDHWVDERRDPLLATRAAAAHLKDLYEDFGSWYLAAAAYNGGSTRVRRAIRCARSRDFWTLARRRCIRPETRNYVPKLIAAALIAKQPEKYAFHVQRARPIRYDVVRVSDATSLDVIAEAADVPVRDVVTLNPQLIRAVTPPGQSYWVRLPARSALTFAANFPDIPDGERIRSVEHVVRPGDTLYRIARAYGSDVSAILALNDDLHPRRLRVGQHVLIPNARSLRGLSRTD